MSSTQSWIEIDSRALEHNLATFRTLVGPNRAIMAVVKANAYGHGMEPIARLAVDAGANWLAVFTLEEALALRSAGLDLPILVFGPTPAKAIEAAAAADIRLTLTNPVALKALIESGVSGIKVHIKLETGTHRQGFQRVELDCLRALHTCPNIEVEGAYTHFADIEDTTDHTFAMQQLNAFFDAIEALRELGFSPTVKHAACSAASLLFPSTGFDLVRVGISMYGLWPSKETLVSVRQSGLLDVALKPVMTWKTRIVQVSSVEAGETVGYGRTFKTTRASRLAVLPIGYANGYDRGLSNCGFVLVHGRRANVCGRVMMNMVVVDVTDISEAAVGDEVVLLGQQGDEAISADTMAAWLGTIHYEVVTRVDPGAERVVI